MGYKRKFAQEDVPGYGAIFMSNTGTKKECFQRKLFGLPLAQTNFVLHVKKGMYLFLFEFERRQLHGVFRATANGEIDIEPDAFRSSGKHFPAQVPFTSVWNCYPLDEHEFKGAIRDNYFSWKKFKFGLSKDQVYKLMDLFCSKRTSKSEPPRPCLNYDDKPLERDTGFDDSRKTFRDRSRIKFMKEEDDHGFEIDEAREVDDDQGYRTLKKERSQNHNKEVFLRKYMKESDDFGNGGFRKLDKRLDRSLGRSRRLSDESLHFMCDINSGNEMNDNFHEVNGRKTHLEKIKVEHNTEDGYRRFGKIRVASKDENFLVDKKNKYFRDDIRVQDEYHALNGFSQNLSSRNNLGSPKKESQTIVDGCFFRHGTVESQQRTLTDHPLSKPKRVTNIYQKPNYESRTSPFEPRRADFGIKSCSDEEFDLGNVAPATHNNQSNSDFIPISEVSEQFQHPSEFNIIENTYEHRFPNSTSCDPLMTTNDPEVPEFCHRPSYFAPGPGSSPIDNRPVYPIPYHSETKDSDLGKCTSKYVHKASVFDRVTSAPKAVNHKQKLESDEQKVLDASVNKVMKMLEKIVSSPNSNVKQDDGDNKVVDYEARKKESDVDIDNKGIEGGSMLQETKIANKNFSDEFKENTSGTESDMGKRRKLVRPVFVKKENENTSGKVDSHLTKADESQKTSMVCEENKNAENTPLKVDSHLAKAVESLENIEGQKSSMACEENEKAENCQVLEKQWQEKWGFDAMKWGFDDMAQVDSSRYEHKMCGWIEE